MINEASATRDGATEQRILDAAHRVFVRAGTAGARMQEIAREAGVNSALLHYYFRSKERLSQAVFERAAAQLLPAVIGILASDLPLDEKVTQVVHVEIDRLSQAPFLPGYIISELTHHPERVTQLLASITGRQPKDVGSSVLAVLRRQIDAEVAAGRLRPIAPEQFAASLLALCVFPFAARPMLIALFGHDESGFQQFIAERRRELPAFFLNALKP